jgi:serine protease Do
MIKKLIAPVGLLTAAVILTFVWFVVSDQAKERNSPVEEIDPNRRAISPRGLVNESSPQDTAGDLTKLRDLQERVSRTVGAVQRAVVAVKNPKQATLARAPRHETGGSGVILTPEGLVLSQYHVSHLSTDGEDFKPGDKTTVILSDGRACPAELLGGDRTHDLSLLQLLTPGPYPYVPLQPNVILKRGAWVLKLGHPMAYRRDRPAPVRLGRVICCAGDTFVTDCLTASGDSGGPYFDVDGQLVGVMGIASGDLLKILPEDDYYVSHRFDQLIFSCTGSRQIHACLESMLRREVQASVGRKFLFELAESERLPIADWSQGVTTRAKHRSSVGPSRASVVAVLSGDVQVALGSVIAAQGWILTKASELPPQPKCRLWDGKLVEAQVVGADPAFDLALLKVDLDDLKAVTWADALSPKAGTILAAVDSGELPLAVGVVSVERRSLTDASPPEYSLPLRILAAPPAIFGKEEQGHGYVVEKTRGLALSAGILPGDLLKTLADRPVHSHKDLAACVQGMMTGDRVAVTLSRSGRRLELSLPLGSEEAASGGSFRADDFPTVFEHDVPLLPHECGGPILDLDGRALGITIARVGPHGCLAIPGDCVLRLLPDLQSGKLGRNWKGPKLP